MDHLAHRKIDRLESKIDMLLKEMRGWENGNSKAEKGRKEEHQEGTEEVEEHVLKEKKGGHAGKEQEKVGGPMFPFDH